jgi:hypothetical protein
MTKLPLKQDFLNMYLGHSFETRPGHRPGQGIGSRVRWVDSGQLKKKTYKKKTHN